MIFEIKFTDGKRLQPTKVIGVGRNYSEHIKEMNSEKTAEPVLFTKPTTALCSITEPLAIPVNYGSVHHEIELAVCIGKETHQLSNEPIEEYIAGYGLALDLTLRDIQSAAKKKGLPWAIAKGFDFSCPVSEFVPASDLDNVNNLNLNLKVNNEIRQSASTSQMLFSISELIRYTSRFFTLLPGDLILTGTPSGVGSLTKGDTIEAEISNISHIKTKVV